MNKEVILQRAIDHLADMVLSYRMNNIKKEKLQRCIGGIIHLFISMGREKEIKSFLINSFGCGALDRDFLTDAQLYWLGKFKGQVDDIKISNLNLFKVSDLCLLSICNVEYEYIVEFEELFKDIMSNEYDIYDLCYIVKWLSVFNFECELIPIIVNYVYLKYKLLNEKDKIVEYWFNFRKSVDDLVEDYNNRIQFPEIVSRIVIEYNNEYYIWRLVNDDKKYVFFVIPNKIFSFRESDGINIKFTIYDLIKCKELGGINNWKELIEYIRDNNIIISIKAMDRIWMGIDDFFKRW